MQADAEQRAAVEWSALTAYVTNYHDLSHVMATWINYAVFDRQAQHGRLCIRSTQASTYQGCDGLHLDIAVYREAHGPVQVQAVGAGVRG